MKELTLGYCVDLFATFMNAANTNVTVGEVWKCVELLKG
jgi:hypothetical protein